MAGDNWGKFFAGGAVVVGISLLGYFFVIRPYLKGREEEIEELLDEVEREVAELATYTMRIEAEGIPEEVYSSAIESMQASITAKLERAKELVAENTIVDRIVGTLYTFGIAIAAGLMLAILAIGGFYATAWLIKEIFKNIRKPPNFPCGKCPATFSTEAALKEHMRTAHPPTTEAALISEAQLQFQQLPYWVQAGIAAEAEVYERAYQPWTVLESWEILAIAIASAVFVAWLITTAPAAIPVLLLT